MNKELKNIEKMQSFLWEAFCNAESVGVLIDDLLTWPGLHLTSEQIESVEAHYYQSEVWTEEDEEVRDIVAAATDSQDYNRLDCWLIWTVGDQTAADLVSGWTEEN